MTGTDAEQGFSKTAMKSNQVQVISKKENSKEVIYRHEEDQKGWVGLSVLDLLGLRWLLQS